MKHDRLLILATVLSVLLFTFHLADDIVRGVEEGGPWNLTAIPIFVTWLWGALVLSGRRSGYVVMLLGSVLGSAAPILHFQGAGGVAGRGIAASSGAFFWVWTLVALGVTSVFAMVLSVYGLWRSFRPRAAE